MQTIKSNCLLMEWQWNSGSGCLYSISYLLGCLLLGCLVLSAKGQCLQVYQEHPWYNSSSVSKQKTADAVKVESSCLIWIKTDIYTGPSWIKLDFPGLHFNAGINSILLIHLFYHMHGLLSLIISWSGMISSMANFKLCWSHGSPQLSWW